MKRDIRSQDHQPLQLVEEAGLPFIILLLFEPTLLAQPDCSLRHLQFQYQSVLSFNQQQTNHGKWINLCHAEAITAFSQLQAVYDIQNIYSYQESGTELSWQRDKAVARFCREQGIRWVQCQKDGVRRGFADRADWDKSWFAIAHSQLIRNVKATQSVRLDNPFKLTGELEKALADYPAAFQPAGEEAAWRYLASFVAGRGKNYHKLISKPGESRLACSRLSPFLAWGNISSRQVYQFVKNHPNYSTQKMAFSGMLTRLKWRCHFIQKFEMECSYETRCINQGYESLTHENKAEFLKAWQMGRTGFPLVDACMRCLQATGWINFRMRAMLVSVLCHQLDIDWRLGVYHLAQLFLDYEPGIHYPQFQMQAGTTGVNTIRMYNPVKQSQEHDPEAVFIKKWVPELRNVPVAAVHEPWKMTAMEQQFAGIQVGVDYPLPLVDLAEASKRAKDKIWGHRRDPLVKTESRRIVKKHTRNSKQLPGKRSLESGEVGKSEDGK